MTKLTKIEQNIQQSCLPQESRMKRNDWQSCWRLTARRWSSWWSESTNGMRIPRLSCWSWTNATRWQRGRICAGHPAALEVKNNTPLSQAALEVLAIIAYNQPVSRAFIEQVRGVDSSSTVSKLMERGLIEEAGRLDLPGKPVAFRVTDTFLRVFGLGSLADLPPLHDAPQKEEELPVQQTLEELQ